MKNIIFLLIIFSIASCNKEPETESFPLSKLKIENIKQFLPLTLITGKSKAIFVNSDGDEKVLLLSIIEENETKRIGNKSYEAERISIIYTDPESSEYSIYIDGSGNYLQEDSPNLYITCGLNQFITGYSPKITISELGNPILAKYFDNHLIADLSFDKVFTNYPVEEPSIYSYISYTMELGVVGFNDKNGDVFALKEYKE